MCRNLRRIVRAIMLNSTLFFSFCINVVKSFFEFDKYFNKKPTTKPMIYEYKDLGKEIMKSKVPPFLYFVAIQFDWVYLIYNLVNKKYYT